MFDRIYVFYSRRKDKPPDPSYKPSDSIQQRRLLNAKSDKLAVIFPGWHMHQFPTSYLVRRLQKKGWAVLVYDFNDNMLEPEDKIVVDSLRYIRDEIANDLHKLNQVNHYKKINFVGISLGNVPLALVTDKFRGFTDATLVVAGDDLAIDMWHGMRTLFLRDEFRKMHVSMRQLDDEWEITAPINHVKHFANKNVNFYMSLHDNLIRTEYQKHLATRISHTGARLEIRKSRFGHALTVFRFCLFGHLA